MLDEALSGGRGSLEVPAQVVGKMLPMWLIRSVMSHQSISGRDNSHARCQIPSSLYSYTFHGHQLTGSLALKTSSGGITRVIDLSDLLCRGIRHDSSSLINVSAIGGKQMPL